MALAHRRRPSSPWLHFPPYYVAAAAVRRRARPPAGARTQGGPRQAESRPSQRWRAPRRAHTARRFVSWSAHCASASCGGNQPQVGGCAVLLAPFTNSKIGADVSLRPPLRTLAGAAIAAALSSRFALLLPSSRRGRSRRSSGLGGRPARAPRLIDARLLCSGVSGSSSGMTVGRRRCPTAPLQAGTTTSRSSPPPPPRRCSTASGALLRPRRRLRHARRTRRSERAHPRSPCLRS